MHCQLTFSTQNQQKSHSDEEKKPKRRRTHYIDQIVETVALKSTKSAVNQDTSKDWILRLLERIPITKESTSQLIPFLLTAKDGKEIGPQGFKNIPSFAY